MNFTKSELETLYQNAAPTKEETLAGLKEIVPVLERKDDLLSKMIVENTIRKLEKLAEPECSRFIADNRTAFIEKRDHSIRQRLAAAKAGKGEPVLQGHDLAGMERFLPETRHMVTVDILNSDSPVGFPGERYRFFLSDEGYKNARASENRGEIRIRKEDLQRLRGFRLLDDDFLTKCFEGDTASIELVLQIVLEKPDLKVLDVRTQVFVENLLNRSVRFDILATDSTGAKINVEIQRANNGTGRKRARYNSIMMDATLLKKGDDFDNLPETWVVFITENDVIGKGLPLYPVERCFLGTGERFEDGSHILYVNGAYRGDTPIGKLMHDFSCTNAADMYYTTLADRVRFFKESKEDILIMCKVMEDMRKESLQEGVKEGIKEGAINT